MISFSGIDCSGKSTQIDLLVREYKKLGIDCEIVWSRGGYTPGISYLKKLIKLGKSGSKDDIVRFSENINRSSFLRKILFIFSILDLLFYYSIILRIKECFGKTIICDRYIWDTYIDFKIKYPKYNLEHSILWKIIIKTMIKPKYSFVLILPAEESVYRSNFKNEPFSEPLDKREIRIAMYLEEINNKRWQYKIDATKSINEIFLSIWGICNRI